MKEGYYKAQRNGQWTVAYFDSLIGKFLLCGDNQPYTSQDFDLIRKTPIKLDVEDKDPSLYTEMIEIYDEFCRKKTSLGAKIDGEQGKAMNSIIAYLKVNLKNQNEDGVKDAFIYIFTNWHKLDNFLQNQMKLSQINSNLINILNQLRNGFNKSKSEQTASKNNDIRNAVAKRNGSN